jgi:hypothetical protein
MLLGAEISTDSSVMWLLMGWSLDFKSLVWFVNFLPLSHSENVPSISPACF